MDLNDKVALITGAKRIGAAVAEQLAVRGVDIALCYARSRDEAERTAARVEAAGRRAAIVQADLSAPDACREIVEQTIAALGRIDILINMASVYVQRAFDELTLDDWSASLN